LEERRDEQTKIARTRRSNCGSVNRLSELGKIDVGLYRFPSRSRTIGACLYLHSCSAEDGWQFECSTQSDWQAFNDWITTSPSDYTVSAPFAVHGLPAQDYWSAAYAKQNQPDRGSFDQRPGAPEDNMWFAEQDTELGAFIHGFQSIWLPAALLESDRQERFAEVLFAATRHWSVALHFNKGLAGTNAADVAAARDTAMNPAALTAFALAIIAGADAAAYADLYSAPRDLATARRNASDIGKAADELRSIVPNPGSYVSESNYFERDWQRSFWGQNYPRLRAVKVKYDPAGLFFVHQGVGSEEWSADGFTRLA
jgi:hypothetical protein